MDSGGRRALWRCCSSRRRIGQRRIFGQRLAGLPVGRRRTPMPAVCRWTPDLATGRSRGGTSTRRQVTARPSASVDAGATPTTSRRCVPVSRPATTGSFAPTPLTRTFATRAWTRSSAPALASSVRRGSSSSASPSANVAASDPIPWPAARRARSRSGTPATPSATPTWTARAGHAATPTCSASRIRPAPTARSARASPKAALSPK